MRALDFRSFTTYFLAAGIAVSTQAVAQPASTDAVIRVVDIGAGLCVVATAPGGHAMLYDAGPPGATRCVEAARELVPGRRFDLVVLSHSDNDHVSMIPALLQDRPGHLPGEFSAVTIIHPGDPRGPALVPVRAAISDQARRGACVYNLFAIDHPPPSGPAPPAGPPPCRPGPAKIGPGDSFPVGTATATFVAGWSNGNIARAPGEAELDGGPLNNNLSIVIRFDFGGHSVLLTGDTVGRMLVDPDTTCAYAERFMAGNQARARIDSDVLIGQHHGANNSTSTCFVRAVSPEFVVFSAGHHFRHPTQRAATRLTTNGVRADRIFRTDQGDNEGGNEMAAGRGRCPDRPGDDDVEVRLPRSSTAPVRVSYRGASARCGH